MPETSTFALLAGVLCTPALAQPLTVTIDPTLLNNQANYAALAGDVVDGGALTGSYYETTWTPTPQFFDTAWTQAGFFACGNQVVPLGTACHQSPRSVPEPASLATLGVGLIGLVGLRFAKR